MSTASTKAKQRWNKAHYAEIKASLEKDLVKQFKARCKENEVSIASVLAMHMREYCGKPFCEKPLPSKEHKKTIQCDTRPKRRKMVSIIADQLDDILQSETVYRENIPDNITNSMRAEAADYSIDKLSDALELIREAY
jgi:hypothetical protein